MAESANKVSHFFSRGLREDIRIGKVPKIIIYRYRWWSCCAKNVRPLIGPLLKVIQDLLKGRISIDQKCFPAFPPSLIVAYKCSGSLTTPSISRNVRYCEICDNHKVEIRW